MPHFFVPTQDFQTGYLRYLNFSANGYPVFSLFLHSEVSVSLLVYYITFKKFHSTVRIYTFFRIIHVIFGSNFFKALSKSVESFIRGSNAFLFISEP